MSAGPERRALAIAGLSVALGPVVLAVGFAPFDQRVGWLTVLSCWTVTATGLITWLRHPFHAAGPLLILAGFSSMAAAVCAGIDSIPGTARTVVSALPWLLLGHAVLVAVSRIRNPFGARGVIALYVALVIATLAGQDVVAGAMNLLSDSRLIARVVESVVALWVVALVFADAGRRQRIVDLILDLDPATDVSSVAQRLSELAERSGIAVDDGRTRRSLDRALLSIEERRRLELAVERELVELSASRRRIVEAADAENRQLRSDLDEHVGWRLRSLASRLQALPVAGSDAAPAAALEHVRRAQRDMDAILDGLPPGDLGQLGLTDAISALASRSPVPIRFSARGDLPSDDAVRTALYFTCSEAVSNAIRHAGATAIDVELASDERTCRLTISDDGMGGTMIGGSNGTGLLGVRDRLDAVGGRLEIQSPVGGGTLLTGTVPAS